MPRHAPGHQKYFGQWSKNVAPQETQESYCVYFEMFAGTTSEVSSSLTNMKKWASAVGYAMDKILGFYLAVREPCVLHILYNGFFSLWTRVINPKRLCFFENTWHFLIFLKPSITLSANNISILLSFLTMMYFAFLSKLFIRNILQQNPWYMWRLPCWVVSRGRVTRNMCAMSTENFNGRNKIWRSI